MREYALPLAVVACLLVAGCASMGAPAPETTTTPGATTSTTSTTETTVTTTPGSTTTTSNCPPYGNFSKRSLPDRPANLTRETATEFVRAYEEATVWNGLIEDPRISVGVGVSSVSVVNETETGYVLHAEGGFGFEDCLDGSHVAGDGVIRTNYFVNGTTVVRLNSPPNRTTDPRENGTVVERWS